MTRKEYHEAYGRPRCAFFKTYTVENGGENEGEVDWEERPCGKPAVAIYVADDETKECRPVCKDCRAVALEGDGPTYDLVYVEREEG